MGGTRQLFDPALGRAVGAAVHARDDLPPGTELPGPALITEDETTIVVAASRTARVLADGCIELTLKEAAHG
jgi:N-methylhydantoinase A